MKQLGEGRRNRWMDVKVEIEVSSILSAELEEEV